MALKLGSRVLDAGLNVLRTEANEIWVLFSSPADYAAASSAKLGSAAAAFGTVTNASGSRRIANPAITGGTVTAVGAASHWAAVDTVNSRLLATDTLSGGVTTNMGMAWTLGGIAVLRLAGVIPTPPPLADGQAYVDQQRGLFIHYNMATYGGADFVSATLPNNTFDPTALDVRAVDQCGSTVGRALCRTDSEACGWVSSLADHDHAAQHRQYELVCSQRQSRHH